MAGLLDTMSAKEPVTAAALNARGQTTASLWVFSDNLGARRFYERLGAVAVEQRLKTFFDQEAQAVKYLWPNLDPLLTADD